MGDERAPYEEEYIRLRDIVQLPETLCWNGYVHPPGGEGHKSYWEILKLPRFRFVPGSMEKKP